MQYNRLQTNIDMRLFLQHQLIRIFVGLLLFCSIVVALGSIFSWGTSSASNLGVRYNTSYNGRPMTWKACDSINIIINSGVGGELAILEITATVHELAKITNIPMSVVGRTSLIPTTQFWSSPPVDLASANVLIAWVLPSQTDMLTANDAGRAFTDLEIGLGDRHIVTGVIALDETKYNEYSPGSGVGQTRRNLLLHELGHLLGLAHYKGNVLMNPTISKTTPDGFTEPELAGLQQLYNTRCP
jgi:hypothetical protein